jgi:hypothetical protein
LLKNLKHLESPNGGNLGDLFHTINTTTDTWTKIVGTEFYGYRRYPINANTCKCALTWWWIKEHEFPIVINLAR